LCVSSSIGFHPFGGAADMVASIASLVLGERGDAQSIFRGWMRILATSPLGRYVRDADRLVVSMLFLVLPP